MIIPDEITRTAVDKYCALARVIKENGSLAVMQINHAGRQSPNFIGGRIPFVRRPLSASATEVGQNSRDGILTNITNYILFQEAREMSEMDIADVTEKFMRGARLAHLSGFDGVQIHAAHGCKWHFLFDLDKHSLFRQSLQQIFLLNSCLAKRIFVRTSLDRRSPFFITFSLRSALRSHRSSSLE